VVLSHSPSNALVRPAISADGFAADVSDCAFALTINIAQAARTPSESGKPFLHVLLHAVTVLSFRNLDLCSISLGYWQAIFPWVKLVIVFSERPG